MFYQNVANIIHATHHTKPEPLAFVQHITGTYHKIIFGELTFILGQFVV